MSLIMLTWVQHPILNLFRFVRNALVEICLDIYKLFHEEHVCFCLDELKLNVSRAAQDMIEDFVSNTVVSSANCVPLINTMSGTNASAAKNFTSLAKITGKLVDGCGEKKLGNSTIHKAMDWMAEVFEEGPQDDADFCEVNQSYGQINPIYLGQLLLRSL